MRHGRIQTRKIHATIGDYNRSYIESREPVQTRIRVSQLNIGPQDLFRLIHHDIQDRYAVRTNRILHQPACIQMNVGGSDRKQHNGVKRVGYVSFPVTPEMMATTRKLCD